MNIMKKRKSKSIVAVLCALMMLIGIVPADLFVSDTVDAAGNTSVMGDTFTVMASLYDYYTDEEIEGNPITSSTPAGYQDPFTKFNTAISGDLNYVTVYFNNPQNWYTVKIYAWYAWDDENSTILTGGDWSASPGMSYNATGVSYGGVTYKYSYTIPVTLAKGTTVSIILWNAADGSQRYEYRTTVKVGYINYCQGVNAGENESSRYAPAAYVDDGRTLSEGAGLSDPLYFGTFWKGQTSGDYTTATAPEYNNFHWAANITQRNQYNSSLRGLVGNTLGDDGTIYSNNGVALPYFNSQWLKDKGVGASYNNAQFTFKKNTSGYYYFDSSEKDFGYYYDKNTGEVQMGADYAVYNNATDSATNGYGFFPFDIDAAGRTDGSNSASLNMGFGMNFNIDFTLPRVVADETSPAYSSVDEKVKDDNGNDMVFNFRGDDDVWVYLDGKLALDLGGAHSKAGGSINFTQGTVRLYNSIDYTDSTKDTIMGANDATRLSTVGATETTWKKEQEAGYINWDISGSENDTVYYVEYTFDQLGIDISTTQTSEDGFYYKGYDGSTHTIQFFYMERGMIESNLYTSFNFVVVPSSLTIVEKTNFDNVNEGLKTRTMAAANMDVFNYAITNKGTSADYTTSSGGNGGILYPYTDLTVTRKVKNGAAEVASTKLSSGEQIILQYNPPTNYADAITSVWLHVYLSDASGNTLSFTRWDAWDEDVGWDGNTGEYVKMTRDDTGDLKVDLSSYSTEEAGGKTFAEFYDENKEDYPNIYVKLFGIQIPGWIPAYYNAYETQVQFGYKYILDENGSDVFNWTASYKTESIPEIETVTGNFIPGEDSNVASKVANVNFVRNDDFAESSIVGRTSDEGILSLMFSQEALFLQQFEEYSVLTVEQNKGLSVLETENNVAKLTSPALASRSVSDYYSTSWTLKDAKNVEIAKSSSSTVISDSNNTDSFQFVNSAATQINDENIPVALTAEYTNTAKVGALTITKKMSNEDETPSEKFEFLLKLTNIFGQQGVNTTAGDSVKLTINGVEKEIYFDSNSIATIELGAGETAVITGIPVGTSYTISENSSENFELDNVRIIDGTGIVVDSTGTISEGGEISATFTNKRKTGTLSLEKKLQDAEGNAITSGEDVNTEFTFQVIISSTSFAIDTYYTENTIKVMNGENEIATSWTSTNEGKQITANLKVKATDNIVIEGIPYEASYSVSEINIPDDWVANSTNNTGEINSTTPEQEASITNSKKATTNIEITKVDAEDNDKKLPNVEFKLEKLVYDEVAGKEVVDETFEAQTATTDSGGIASFAGLKDGTYQITETNAADGYKLLSTSIKVVIDRTNGCTVDGVSHTVDSSTNTLSFMVENEKEDVTLTNIKITKVDAANSETKLSGVEFKLEKLVYDEVTREEVVDETFEAQTVSTGTDENNKGIAEFSNLEDGTYRITETKTADGYYLLSAPIKVVIDRTNGCTVDNDNCTVIDDTISFTVTNRKIFTFPLTGGYGVTIFALAGLLLIGMAGLIYIKQKKAG